jgi:hypothetical protein
VKPSRLKKKKKLVDSRAAASAAVAAYDAFENPVMSKQENTKKRTQQYKKVVQARLV